MAIRLVLFDLDGTLVDSNGFHIDVWSQVFAEASRPVSHDLIAKQIGKGGDLLVPALLPDVTEAEQEALSKRHGEIYRERYLDRVRPFPGARDLIVRVHEAGQRVVLASSAKQDELDHYIDLLDVRGIVDAATSADEVETSKPAPDIFAAALAKASPATAGEAMMIGDTPYDVLGAAKCGIGTVALRSGGFSDAELKDAGAAAIYDDVAALLADYLRSPLAR